MRRRKYEVIELGKEDAEEIERVFREVWPRAYEYPEGWRRKRTMTAEQIRKEMDEGYHYFGVRVGGRLVGVYKAKITERGCFGEQQSILPEFRNRGIASAMYEQFIEFARRNKCKVNYVNILVGQESGERLVRKFGFRKVGKPYEQYPGMLVQMWEREVEGVADEPERSREREEDKKNTHT
ncbi:MAG: GNAT family N-acetyltransferase [Candidatus Alkanophagales archaeon]